MIQQNVFLERLLEVVKKLYNGKVSLILFGSRATKYYSDFSDFDIMVVLEKVKDALGEAIKIRRNLRNFKERRYPLDLVIVEIQDLSSPLVKQMLKNHLLLYDGLNVKRYLD